MPEAARTHLDLRVIAQDPSVTGEDGTILTATIRVPWSRMEDGPRGPRFHVVDFDASTGRYLLHRTPPDDDLYADASDEELVGDFAFHAQQVYAVASRTLATFESALGRRLAWGFSGHHLHLVPHAFAEANAYYSFEDRALLFGYVPAVEGRPPVYTCLSYDVVVHETTHAVLDGLRRRFLEPGLPDQAALHEGLADVVAMLSVFAMRPVVEHALGSSHNGRISGASVTLEKLRGGVLTGVAEQIGHVLTQGRGALRSSALNPPPQNWASLPQYAEPHRRGEVLVAVVLDVLLDIWLKRLDALFSPGQDRKKATLDRSRAAEEGAKAATHLLTMLIRGLDYLPPVEFELPDLLLAVLLADIEMAPDDDLNYRQSLIDRFARAEVTVPRDWADNRLDTENPPDFLAINFSALRSSRDEVFRFLWNNAPLLGIDTDHYITVETVLPSQRIGPDGLIVAETVATYVQMLDLKASELERISSLNLPSGIDPDTPVQVFGGGTLVFDQFGHLKLHLHKDLGDWWRQIRRLEYLHRTGRRDTRKRLGFSDGAARFQAFAELHNTDTTSGEAW